MNSNETFIHEVIPMTIKRIYAQNEELVLAADNSFRVNDGLESIIKQNAFGCYVKHYNEKVFAIIMEPRKDSTILWGVILQDRLSLDYVYATVSADAHIKIISSSKEEKANNRPDMKYSGRTSFAGAGEDFYYAIRKDEWAYKMIIELVQKLKTTYDMNFGEPSSEFHKDMEHTKEMAEKAYRVFAWNCSVYA